MRASDVPRRRWPYALLALASVGGLFFSLSGFAMAGSFTVADPAHLAHWQTVAYVYLGLMALSLGALIVAGVALWRRRLARSAVDELAV